MRQSGVYKIYCNVNNKTYIGSSNNLHKRLKEHLRNLKNNKHYNKNLQKAFNKYGEESFTFEILFTCLEKDRFKLEQYFIDVTGRLFNSAKHVVYNKRNKVKISTKKKISETLKERQLDESQLIHIKQLGSKYGSENGKKVSKKVKVIIDNVELIFKSVSEASIELNINRSLLTHRLSGRTSNDNKQIKIYYAEG